jgi:hypothetical protein
VGCVGSGTEIALFIGIVVVFTGMGVVFWAIGQRELRRQQEAAGARRRAAIADAVALFELAAVADRVALEARRRELEPDVAETVAPAQARE